MLNRLQSNEVNCLRRSKLDLVLGVLRTVNEGITKPTRIMYTVNLSWKPTQVILQSLIDQGLLELNSGFERKSRKCYSLTEKGIGVINYFDGAKHLLNVDDISSDT